MALQKQMIDIPLAQGVDTHVDPKLTKGNLQLENGLISHEGTVKKAPGVEYFCKSTILLAGAAGSAISGGLAVVPSLSETDVKAVFDVDSKDTPVQFHAWDLAINAWRPIGIATPCDLKLVGGPRKTGMLCDAVYGHNHILFLTHDISSYNVYASIVCRATGAVLKENILVGTNAAWSRLGAAYVSDGAGGYRFITISPTTNEFWSWNPASLAAIPSISAVAYNLSVVFDTCEIDTNFANGAGNTLLLATHVQNGAGADLYIYSVHPTTGALTAVGSHASGDSWANRPTSYSRICVCAYWSQTLGQKAATTYRIALGYVSNINGGTSLGLLTVQTYDAAGTYIGTSTSSNEGYLVGCAGFSKTAGGLIFLSDADTTTMSGFAYNFTDAGALGVNCASYLYLSALATPFAINGRVYIPLYKVAPSGATAVVENDGILCMAATDEDGACSTIGHFALGCASASDTVIWASPPHAPSKVRQIPGSAQLAFGFDYVERVSTEDTSNLTDVCAKATEITLDQATPTFATRKSRVETGVMHAVMPGALRLYDGRFQDEPQLFPYIGTPADTASAGSVSAGKHYVTCVYEWIDRNGDRHQSAPSVAASWTAAGSKTATITCESLGVGEINNLTFYGGSTSRLDSVRLVAYMSAVGDPVNFYRAAYAANSAISGLTTITIDTTDTALKTKELLRNPPTASIYDGALPNLPIPCMKLIGSDETRFYGVPTDDPGCIWFSQEIEESWGVQWNPLLKIRIPDGGAITGFSVQDGNKIVFKEDSIYAFSGSGPDNTGSGWFSQVRKLPENMGCEDPPSVVSTLLGTFYKSKFGIFLLDRGLHAQYIGKAVEAYNNNHVKAAAPARNEQRVYFVLDSGVVLVYDFHHDIWSTLNYGIPVVHGQFCGNYFTAITADGTVIQDNPNRINDQKLTIETGWIKLANIAGYSRIWEVLLLGDYAINSRLKVEMSYDFDNAIVETAIIEANSGIGGVTGSLFRLVPARQRCSAMKLKITDFPEDGKVINLNGMTLVVGVDSERAARVPVSAQG